MRARFGIPVLVALVFAAGIYLWPAMEQQGRRLIGAVLLPFEVAAFLREPPDKALAVPIPGLRARELSDTWGAARSEGRTHEGQDLFAPRGTPIHPAAPGYVVRVGENRLGGNIVVVTGRGVRNYYYAHLESFGPDAVVGRFITATSTIGYVGTSGNATGTPPHLHFGIYTREGPMNPYPLFKDL